VLLSAAAAGIKIDLLFAFLGAFLAFPFVLGRGTVILNDGILMEIKTIGSADAKIKNRRRVLGVEGQGCIQLKIVTKQIGTAKPDEVIGIKITLDALGFRKKRPFWIEGMCQRTN